MRCRRLGVVVTSILFAAFVATTTPGCSSRFWRCESPYRPPASVPLLPGSAEAALDAAGFALQAGRLKVVDFSQCCEWPSCFGNNPSSPYLAVSMWRGPGQTAANTAEDDDGTAVAWRLGADEAVVVIGRTPPRSAYFGYTLELFDRARVGPLRRYLLASLGDTLNNLVIGTDGPAGSPFERRVAIIVTSNRTTERRVRAALVGWGLPDAAINTMPIATPLARPGLDEDGDTFQLLHRIALPEDRARAAAYLAAPSATVLRVSPRRPIAAAPFATPALRRHGTGTTEASLQTSLERLHAAILAKHGRADAQEISVAHRPPFLVDQFGTYCIERGRNCLADNHDTLYPTSRPFFLLPSDRVVVWGVNHETAGKATYANFTVYGIAHLVGVVSVDSRQLAGSAADYVPDDPNIGKLYAWTIARDCGSDRHCTEVPTGCPGVGLMRRAFIAFRMYMEPATATSPHPAELLIDHVTRFSR